MSGSRFDQIVRMADESLDEKVITDPKPLAGWPHRIQY